MTARSLRRVAFVALRFHELRGLIPATFGAGLVDGVRVRASDHNIAPGVAIERGSGNPGDETRHGDGRVKVADAEVFGSGPGQAALRRISRASRSISRDPKSSAQ